MNVYDVYVADAFRHSDGVFNPPSKRTVSHAPFLIILNWIGVVTSWGFLANLRSCLQWDLNWQSVQYSLITTRIL